MMLARLFAVALPGLFGAAAALGAYPEKPIRLVIPFSPGGGTDLVARVLAQKFTEQTGTPVVFDNRPGANGTIAGELVARANPDGYTVLYNTSSMVLSPLLVSKMSFDFNRELAPVVKSAIVPLVLVVHPSVPVASVKEFVAHARANPDRMSYGSAGNGNVSHLAVLLFSQAAGFSAVHVPYKGVAPALADLIGGQIQFMADTVNTSVAFVRDRRIRALAVTSAKRVGTMPEVPTLAETLMPNFETGAWQGVMVPARTPAEVVRKLNAEFMKALQDPDARARLAAQGAEPLGSTPQEYATYLKAETERWEKVVRTANVRLD